MLGSAVEFLPLQVGCVSVCQVPEGLISGPQAQLSPALLRGNQFLHAQQVVRGGEQAKQPVDSRPAT